MLTRADGATTAPSPWRAPSCDQRALTAAASHGANVSVHTTGDVSSVASTASSRSVTWRPSTRSVIAERQVPVRPGDTVMR
ncbi:MAG: hypothetical protein M3137_14185 [Actinomycetota bacterium]|nr:hypothetical protein [Actinomycetota bacterium]